MDMLLNIRVLEKKFIQKQEASCFIGKTFQVFLSKSCTERDLPLNVVEMKW